MPQSRSGYRSREGDTGERPRLYCIEQQHYHNSNIITIDRAIQQTVGKSIGINMTRLFPIPRIPIASLILLLSSSTTCTAQTFTRQVECPNDASVTGYTSLEDLNADMAGELDRIAGGGNPAAEYNFNLCSDPDIVYDARRGNEINIVLDNTNIFCGGPGATNPSCLVTGGQLQVRIENSVVDGYPLNNAFMQGVTFADFRGRSIAFLANTPTVFNCEDCIWQVCLLNMVSWTPVFKTTV